MRIIFNPIEAAKNNNPLNTYYKKFKILQEEKKQKSSGKILNYEKKREKNMHQKA